MYKKTLVSCLVATLILPGITMATPQIASAATSIQNGNFSYPSWGSFQGGFDSNWVTIDPTRGHWTLNGYKTKPGGDPGQDGTISGWNFSKFAWESTQAAGDSSSWVLPNKGVELQKDVSGNIYAEIIAGAQNKAIYQDISTPVAESVYYWKLRHAPLPDAGQKTIDRMQVVIGGTAQKARRVTTNGHDFSGAVGNHDSGDSNKVGYISTTLTTVGTGSNRDHEKDWETYEGWYRVPSGGTTRFSFKSVSSGSSDGTVETLGNLIDDVSFQIYYPLKYIVDSSRGESSTDSRLTTGQIDGFAYQNYYKAGTVPTLVNSPTNIKKNAINGRTFTFKGWSKTKVSANGGYVVNSSQLQNANIVTTYNSIAAKKDNQVYPVFARNPQITFQYKYGNTTEVISGYNKKEYSYAAQATSPAAPSVKGYTFKYWQVNSGTANTVSNGSSYKANLTEDTVVTAVYEANPYKVRYNRNLTPWKGNVGGSMADQTMTYDKAASLNANQFTAEYYDFDGWQVAGDSFIESDYRNAHLDDKQQVKNLTATRDAIVNLNAQWVPKPIDEIRKWCDAADSQYNIDNTVTYKVEAKQVVQGATAYATTFTDTLNANGMDMVANGASYIMDSVTFTGPNGTIPASKIDRIQWSADKKSFSVKVREPITYNQTITMTYKVKLGTTTTKALQGKTWYNKATVYADNTPKPEPIREQTIGIYVRLPEMHSSKTVDDDLIDSGDIATFTFKNWNDGDPGSLIYNAGFDDDLSPWLLDDGLEILYDRIKVTDAAGNDISSQVRPVLDGTTLRIHTTTHIGKGQTLTAVVPMRFGDRSTRTSGNAYQDKLSSVSDNADLVQDETTVRVTKPNLQAHKTSSKATINTGETVGFTLEISNTTFGSKAYNVSFTDALDSEAVAGGAYIDAATLKILDQNGTDITSRTAVYWQTSNGYTTGFAAATPAVLAENEIVKVTYDVIAGNHGSVRLQDSSIGNIVTTASSNGGAGGGDEDIVTIYTPVLAIDKSAAKNITPLNGDVEYAIDIWQRNDEATAWNVVVEDTIGTEAVSAGVKYKQDSVRVIDQEGDDRTGECGIHFSDDGSRLTVNTPISLGKNEHMAITYTVHYGNSDDVKLQGRKWTNYASARGANTRMDADDYADVAVPTPAIVASKSVDRSAINTGDTVNFTFSVRQTVPDAVAWNIVMTDEVPEELISAGSAFDLNAATITGPNNKDLRGQSDLSFTGNKLVVKTNAEIGYNEVITVKVPFTFGQTDSTALVNSVFTDKLTVTTDNSSPSQDEETVFVNEPDIAMLKYHNADSIDLTGVIDFTVSAKNIAEDSIAYKVFVEDHLSDEAYEAGAYIDKSTLSVKLASGATVTDKCTVTWFDEEQPSGLKVVYNEALPYDESIIVTYQVIAGEQDSVGLYETGIDNLATGGAANSRYTGNAEAHTSFYTPELRVDKSAAEESVDVGDAIHYKVVVTETKENATAFGIVIDDELDEDSVRQGAYIDTTSLEVLDENGEKIASPNVTWTNIGDDPTKASAYSIDTARDLKQGQTLTVTYTVYAGGDEDADIAGMTIGNVARAHAKNVTAETENETSTNIATPDLVVEKRASANDISVHDSVHYAIIATQTADGASAKNVCLTDELSWKGDVKLVDADAVMDSLTIRHNDQEVVPTKLDYDVKARSGAQDDEWTLVIYIDTAERLYYEDELVVEYDVKYGEEINGLIMPSQSVRNVATGTTSNGSPYVDDAVVYVNDAILDVKKTAELDDDNEKVFYHIELRQTNPSSVARHVVLVDSLDVDSANVGMKILPETFKVSLNGSEIPTSPVWDVEYDNAIGFTLDLDMDVAYEDVVIVDYTADLYDIPFMGVVELKNVISAKASNSIEARDFSYVTWDSGVAAVPVTHILQEMLDEVAMVVTGDGLPYIIGACVGGGAIAIGIRYYIRRKRR